MEAYRLSDVHPNAQIGKDSVVSNFVTIQEDVIIGDNCWIGPGAVIMDGTRIGNNCKIFPTQSSFVDRTYGSKHAAIHGQKN